MSPEPKKWKTLTGPPLTKEQNEQFQRIFLRVQAGTLGRVEGMLQMAKLADEWGFPLDEEDIPK